MKIQTAIASTTHIDKHNEIIAKSALEGMTEQIKAKYIPCLIEHDWKQHGGVLLYGAVFQLFDGEHALGVVFGVFETAGEAVLFASGKPNLVWNDCKRFLDVESLKKLAGQTLRAQSETKLPKQTISQLLETHLDSTQVLDDGTVYKIKKYVASVGDLTIEVYPKDHPPAHFHVVSKQRRINARFSINTIALLSEKYGEISKKDAKKIQNFFKSNPKMLQKLLSYYSQMQQ